MGNSEYIPVYPESDWFKLGTDEEVEGDKRMRELSGAGQGGVEKKDVAEESDPDADDSVAENI